MDDYKTNTMLTEAYNKVLRNVNEKIANYEPHWCVKAQKGDNVDALIHKELYGVFKGTLGTNFMTEEGQIDWLLQYLRDMCKRIEVLKTQTSEVFESDSQSNTCNNIVDYMPEIGRAIKSLQIGFNNFHSVDSGSIYGVASPIQRYNNEFDRLDWLSRKTSEISELIEKEKSSRHDYYDSVDAFVFDNKNGISKTEDQ